MNRAAVSIPSNIAEGAGRNSNKGFSRFITIALGSAFELETQLIIAFELNFIKENEYNSLIKDIHIIQKKIVNFNKYLNN